MISTQQHYQPPQLSFTTQSFGINCSIMLQMSRCDSMRATQQPPRVPVGNYSSSASDMEQQRLPMGKEDSQSNELQDGYDPRGTGLAGRKI